MAPGVRLDSRRALFHESQGWLAVADLHYGYEVHRRRQGALLPDWGMPQCEEVLRGLLEDHQPRRLILVGDVMDGSGSAAQTSDLLDRLGALVPEIVCIEGNHDRPALRKQRPFVKTHCEDGFVFHHGHQIRPGAMDDAAETSPINLPLGEGQEKCVHITGHEHPAWTLRDGAGLRLKLPALVRQQAGPGLEHWILPAFSPWAAGGEYTSPLPRLATWVCAPGRVWQVEGAG